MLKGTVPEENGYKKYLCLCFAILKQKTKTVFVYTQVIYYPFFILCFGPVGTFLMQYYSLLSTQCFTKFIVPDCGDKFDFGIGLSSLARARLYRLAGRYDNPMPDSTMSPIQGLCIWLEYHSFSSLLQLLSLQSS